MIFSSELDLTRPKPNRQSKGGSITKIDRFNRKSLVEKYILSGMSVNDIVPLKIGAKQTILNDIDEIHESWIKQDIGWAKRVVILRIDTEKKLNQQYCRLMTILKNHNLSIRDRMNVENLLQKNACVRKELSSEIDPEEYIEQLISDKINSHFSRN